MFPRRHLVLILLATSLGCARLCGRAETAPPPPPPTPGARLDVPAPPPPDPGRTELAVTGARTLQLRGAGPQLGARWEGLPQVTFTARAGTTVISLFATPPVDETDLSTGKKTRRPVDISLAFDDVRYFWDGLPGSVAVFRPNRIEFDGTLERSENQADPAASGAGRSIRLKGFFELADLTRIPAIDSRIIALLEAESGRVARRHSTFDFGREQDPRAISVVVPQASAQGLVDALRARLGEGWSAWQGTSRFVERGADEGVVEVVVGPARTPADILRLAHVDPINYGLTTEAVVDKVMEWHRAHGVDIRVADVETVELRLDRVPKDVPAFAREVAEFCPDVVDQVLGTHEALVESIRTTRDIPLWWD